MLWKLANRCGKLKVRVYGAYGPAATVTYILLYICVNMLFQAGCDEDGKLIAVEMQLYNNGGNTLDLSDAVSISVKCGTAMQKY